MFHKKHIQMIKQLELLTCSIYFSYAIFLTDYKKI